MSAATARLNDDSSEDEDDRLTRELASLELDDDLPDSIDTPDPETATIKDFQKACNELQMQNAELRRRVRSLVIEVGKMEAATGNSGGKSKRKKRVEIPPEFIQHGDDIHAVGRKAVYALHLWIDPAWFVYRRMPDINYKNPIVRWESLASQQKSMAAETWQYIKNESEQTVFDLTSLMGRHKWFGQVIKKDAQDSKSKLLLNIKDAIPFGIPAVAGPDAASLVRSAEARRNHPVLKVLRGRCFDHFPPIYYPHGTDTTHPDASKVVFYVPEVGYYFRAALYGSSSIVSGKQDSRSNGVIWKAEELGITPNNLAMMFCFMRFHATGEPEFAQREGSANPEKYLAGDPKDDKVDWEMEHSRLFRLFDEHWHEDGTQQIVAAIGRVAFHGASAATVAQSLNVAGASLAVSQRNLQAVATFGAAIPSDLLQRQSQTSTPPLPSMVRDAVVHGQPLQAPEAGPSRSTNRSPSPPLSEPPVSPTPSVRPTPVARPAPAATQHSRPSSSARTASPAITPSTEPDIELPAAGQKPKRSARSTTKTKGKGRASGNVDGAEEQEENPAPVLAPRSTRPRRN
ncbi:hypothetical protein BC629DRAFT_1436015 [Irpex lacteus]|nr:hypothetical protein BC629DRAFT_1436011 [Irpex lacteus]KAI0814935.1 hypothetical protein BC629DRAFT_1436015 [Irpex lacteus]